MGARTKIGQTPSLFDGLIRHSCRNFSYTARVGNEVKGKWGNSLQAAMPFEFFFDGDARDSGIRVLRGAHLGGVKNNYKTFSPLRNTPDIGAFRVSGALLATGLRGFDSVRARRPRISPSRWYGLSDKPVTAHVSRCNNIKRLKNNSNWRGQSR
jgi:hypothetical protein